MTNCPICNSKLPPERPLILCPAARKQPLKPLREGLEVGKNCHEIYYDLGVYR